MTTPVWDRCLTCPPSSRIAERASLSSKEGTGWKPEGASFSSTGGTGWKPVPHGEPSRSDRRMPVAAYAATPKLKTSATYLIASPFANLANIERALRVAGGDVTLADDPSAIANASRVVLPGVGNFGASMRWLMSSGFAFAIREAIERGAFLLGICVGHQLLFDASEEDPSISGLGLISGRVKRLTSGLPVPQVAWNAVVKTKRSFLFDGIDDESSFYFVNSYAADEGDCAVATSEYGGRFAAAVEQGRIFGVQFHPEKSSSAGLKLLRNFVEVGS